MSDFEKNSIEHDLQIFTSRNFEDPSDCRNLEQIKFYVQELGQKISELEKRFNYVPGWAYALVARYHAKQNVLRRQVWDVNK